MNNALIQAFLDKIITEQNLSKNTVSAYKKDLNIFLNFIKNKIKKINVSDITKNDIMLYISHTKLQNKPSTVSRKISSIKAFFNFLFIEKKINKNPCAYIKHPKQQGQKIPISLNQKETENLLKIKTKTKTQLKAFLLFKILYGCGLRISEAINLKLNDIKSDKNGANYFIIQGKGGKERIVPMPDDLVNTLQEFINKSYKFEEKEKIYKKEHFIFTNKQQKRISRQYAARIIKTLMIQNNISAQASPHSLRHTFAIHLLSGGMDIRLVQDLLGHKNISTTQIYTKLDLQKIKHILKKNHPVKNLKQFDNN